MSITVTKDNFQTEVMQAGQPVLLDFYANWCAPCRMVAPVLEEISKEKPDLKICKVNVDEETDLAFRYQVMSIPTLVVVKDGQTVQRAIGAMPKEEILKLLEE